MFAMVSFGFWFRQSLLFLLLAAALQMQSSDKGTPTWLKPGVQRSSSCPASQRRYTCTAHDAPAWLKPPVTSCKSSVSAIGSASKSTRPAWCSPAAATSLHPQQAFSSSSSCVGLRHRRTDHPRPKKRAWMQPPVATSCKQNISSAKRRCLTGSTSPAWLRPSVGKDTDTHNPRRQVHLASGALLLAAHRPRSQCNSYQKAATDESMIKETLKNPSCSCKCGKQIPLRDLYEFCDMFHCMAREDQIVWLQSLYDKKGNLADTRLVTDWFLLGHHVCVPRLMQLLHM